MPNCTKRGRSRLGFQPTISFPSTASHVRVFGGCFSVKEKKMTNPLGDGSFHRLTIVPLISALENLGKILGNAEAHATSLKIDPEVLLNARLYPDMFNLVQQLQYTLYIPVEFARHF